MDMSDDMDDELLALLLAMENDKGDDGRSALPSRTGDMESLGLGGNGGGSAGHHGR
jgi:hypothetical protein